MINLDIMYEQNFDKLPIPLLILMLVFIAVSIFANYKVFEKCGEPGWKAIVPVYNTYTLYKIVYGNGWKFLLLLIPFVNFVSIILVYVKLGTTFNKSTLFKLGLVFLTPIMMLVLAFDDSVYTGPVV